MLDSFASRGARGFPPRSLRESRIREQLSRRLVYARTSLPPPIGRVALSGRNPRVHHTRGRSTGKDQRWVVWKSAMRIVTVCLSSRRRESSCVSRSSTVSKRAAVCLCLSSLLCNTHTLVVSLIPPRCHVHTTPASGNVARRRAAQRTVGEYARRTVRAHTHYTHTRAHVTPTPFL